MSGTSLSLGRACGRLEGDAELPTEAGYRVWIECACGARFERWVTEADVEKDLVNPN